MNATELLAMYERVADAPDAVAKLRRFVLDLAVRGRLHASGLQGWRRFTLGDLGAWGSGGTPLKGHPEYYGGGIPWLVIGDLNDSVVDRSAATLTEAGLLNSSAKLVEPGALLIAMYGSIGKLGITGIRCATNQAIAHCVPDATRVSVEFLFLLVKSLRTKLLSEGQGVAQQNISQRILKAVEVLIPPLAEQQRIVAKVDELMALCDQLEAARTGREAARDRLATASLTRVNAPDPDTFQSDAHFALNVLPVLSARADQVKQLRQTILNLAVRGKLVPQDPSDEPAATLLVRIALERQELGVRQPSQCDEETELQKSQQPPSDRPASWVWSRIEQAIVYTEYGTSEKSSATSDGVPVLAMGNIQHGNVSWGDEKRIPRACQDLPRLLLKRFDLLYNRTNSAELVGKTGIYLGDDDAFTFASYLIRLRPSLRWTNPRFLNIAMNTTEFRLTQIVPHIKKQTGQANVNGTTLRQMLVPLPPLEEQHRIVAKVDELMAICDKLEALLMAGESTRGRLLDALLHHALKPVANVAA